MKRLFSVFLSLALLLCLVSPVSVYAIGEGNVDGGGGVWAMVPALIHGLPVMMVCG